MTPAIVLAAGASARLGEPKQLVKLAGETLLERAVRTAREAGCAPVIVVLGAAYGEILGNCALGDAIHIVNAQWAEGMASSIRLGVHTLQSLAQPPPGVILMTCDQPSVTASHVRALMTSGRITASSYAGRHGVPAYFPATVFAELINLRGDTGARDLLHDADTIHLPGGEVDVDTAADVDEAERLFSRPS